MPDSIFWTHHFLNKFLIPIFSDSFNDRSDPQIVSICELTNSINEQLSARFPEWHAEVVKSLQDGNNKVIVEGKGEVLN